MRDPSTSERERVFRQTYSPVENREGEKGMI